jgi:tetratricopeptide (TPR) repeat protein
MMPEQEENPVVESTDEEEVTVQKVENGSAPAESADVPTTPAEAKPETEVNVQSGGEITESVGSQEVVAADAAATVLETTQDTPTTTETNAQSAEEWNASFQRVYEKSLQAKEEGTAFYKAQQFMSAKVKYAEAMASAQNQSGDFSNEQRALVFEMSLTCSSNMSLCSWSLNEYQECIIHGRNTLLLIGAIESKMSESMIWEELQKKGMTIQKLTSLKLKAYRIVGKAEMEKNDIEAAKSDLEAALSVCDDPKLTKELTDLIQRCTKKLAQQSKKEKSMWKKAFDTNNKIPDDEPISSPNSPVGPLKSSSFKGSSTPKKNTSDNDNVTSNSYDYALPLLIVGALGVAGIAAWWWRKRR